MVYSRLLAIGKSPPPQRDIDNGALRVDYIAERMEAPHKVLLASEWSTLLIYSSHIGHVRSFDIYILASELSTFLIILSHWQHQVMEHCLCLLAYWPLIG